jgi:hypothetical protein
VLFRRKYVDVDLQGEADVGVASRSLTTFTGTPARNMMQALLWRRSCSLIFGRPDRFTVRSNICVTRSGW